MDISELWVSGNYALEFRPETVTVKASDGSERLVVVPSIVLTDLTSHSKDATPVSWEHFE